VIIEHYLKKRSCKCSPPSNHLSNSCLKIF